MRIAWIFLDAGNTLIGLEYAHLVGALSRAGFHTTERELRGAEPRARAALERALIARWRQRDVPRTGWVEAHLWSRYWGDVLGGAGADPATIDRLTAAALEITRPASSWTRTEPDIERTLGALRARGLRLGIISNSSGTLAQHLAEMDLARHFEVIIDSHHAGVEKPHPGIFSLALRHASASGAVSPREALYVGDVYGIDVLGGKDAGLHAALFDAAGLWDPAMAPPGAPPCRVVRSLADVHALVDELEKGSD